MSAKTMLASLCIIATNVFAQPSSPSVQRSEPFPEPTSGANRLLFMPDGNTLFFNFTPRKGIEVTVYNPNHQVSATTRSSIRSWSNWRMYTSQLRGLYAINGQAVVFLEQQIHLKPALYRLVFDAHSGALLSDTLVARLSRPNLLNHHVVSSNPEEIPSFVIKKDPDSDFYGIAMTNMGTRNAAKRIRVLHFSPHHTLLNDAFFEVPDNHLKYIDVADMHVNADSAVFLATFAYNNGVFYTRNSRIIIGKLQPGHRSFQTSVLEHTANMQVQNAALQYNRQDGHIYLLTTVQSRTTEEKPIMRTNLINRFALLMNVINPDNLTVKNHYFVRHNLLDTYAQQHLQYKYPYYGEIQDFRLNPDGSVQLLMEETDVTTRTIYDSTLLHFKTPTTNTITHLGGIGLVKLGADGKELDGYAIAKDQRAEAFINTFALNKRNQSGWTFRAADNWMNLSGFCSYDFFSADGRDYVIYNDYPSNKENTSERYRSQKTVYQMSRTNTVCAVYDGHQINKTWLYGEPAAGESRFTQMEMIARKPDGKSFATMMIERKEGHKQAYIVWVTL
ncbi:hypothetical protein [Chitinophaga flava]|uniref:Arylsulfotransferase N-terminal domain-containing protein n=1 Tax=Chitinophaga flava TaxID=2259036 RepID=A0A365XX43_9BACT|nr:hypothetical protein [Chitinophaga flava]RBL90638.1 hypothetical protein DF182_29750 [Chitinophaga flava]